MTFEKITSRQNPRIRRLVALRERAERTAAGLFLLEGLRELDRAIAGGIAIEEFYFCPELMRAPLADAVFSTAKKILPAEKIFELSAPAFEKISYRERPEGVLALAQMREHSLAALEEALKSRERGEAPELFLVAESIEKPGNLGALLRTADSAGCSALICCGGAGTDVYNPNVVRASQGALFSTPLAVGDSAENVRAWLEGRGVAIFATSPAAKKFYWECDFCVPAAILLGAESTGLTDFWLKGEGEEKSASPSRGNVVPVAIPQCGAADSLNVSVAAAVCLFEALRQRTARGISLRR